MIDKDVTPKNNIIMFRQESANQLAFFASIAVPSTAKKIIFVELMQWHGYVFYRFDSCGIRCHSNVASHSIGFSFIIKHFFRPHYGNRLLVYKSLVRFQAPVFYITREKKCIWACTIRFKMLALSLKKLASKRGKKCLNTNFCMAIV